MGMVLNSKNTAVSVALPIAAHLQNRFALIGRKLWGLPIRLPARLACVF